jgi:hypothetical protein
MYVIKNIEKLYFLALKKINLSKLDKVGLVFVCSSAVEIELDLRLYLFKSGYVEE